MPIQHQQNKIWSQIYVYSINKKKKKHFFLVASDLNYLQGDKGTNTNHLQRLNLESAKVRKAIQLILKKFNIVQRVLRKIIWQSSLQIQREETRRLLFSRFLSIINISVPKKGMGSYTCTELNLDVMKPSVILGTNSSNKLGASPFKQGTDVTNLDHSPNRQYTLLLAHWQQYINIVNT